MSPAAQGGMRLWARPSTMAGGLGAAYLAEALLNAPQILGSLDLLLNPTGAQQDGALLAAPPCPRGSPSFASPKWVCVVCTCATGGPYNCSTAPPWKPGQHWRGYVGHVCPHSH